MYNKCLEYLLRNDPNEVMSPRGITMRRRIRPFLQKLLPLIAQCKLQVERKAEMPKDVPLIYASTHGFTDDIAMMFYTVNAPTYTLIGSLPTIYHSLQGFFLWAIGSIVVDRRDKQSRKASVAKMLHAIDLGSDLIVLPEGVWNMTQNFPVQKLFPGIYDVAAEKGALVVPLAITMGNDGICYSILEEPFDISRYSREEGLKVLRDKMATARWELMEKHAQTKRSDLAAWEPVSKYWEEYVEATIATAKGLYDPEVENNAQYRDKNETPPAEVFAALENVPLTLANARALAVRERFYGQST